MLDCHRTYRSHDVARAEDIDADPLAAPLHCETAAELNDSGFRAVVDACAKALVRDEGTHRPDENDRADTVVLFHLATAAHSGPVHAPEVDVHHLCKSVDVRFPSQPGHDTSPIFSDG